MKAIRRAIQNRYFQLVGHYPASINGIRFRCDPHNVRFWRRVSRGRWEETTFEVLDRFLDPQSVYLDIGAWIGPTVLYAATRARKVYCFEPDYVAYSALLWNIRLNKLQNVVPFNVALSDESGLKTMGSFGGRQGDSMTSLLEEAALQTFKPDIAELSSKVYCLAWDGWLSSTQFSDPPKLVKIDIEGGEFTLLPAMRQYLLDHKPIVYLSLHAPYLNPEDRPAAMRKIVEAMSGYGRCYDEKWNRVSLNTLLQGDSLNRFTTFVFEP